MNNYKYSYAKKYHYLIKYIVLAFPLLLILCSIIFQNGNNTLYNNVLLDLHTFEDLINNSSFFVVWYNQLLNTLGFNTSVSSDFAFIMYYYPLYILLVYLIDIIIDVLVLIPKLCHKFLEKVGGDY